MVYADPSAEEKLAEIHTILNNYGGDEALNRIRTLLYGEPEEDEGEPEEGEGKEVD